MRFPQILSFSLSLVAAFCLASAAHGSEGAFKRLDSSAADAYLAADYKKADSQWRKLLDKINLAIAREGGDKGLNEELEATYRHLGECALAEKNYDLADNLFRQARTSLDGLQETDESLDKDLRDLAVNYRLIDLHNLGNLGIIGPIVNAALSDFRPNKVSIAKTDSGHHVAISLEDDVVKDIGNKGVTQVGVSKNISFDLIQEQGEGGAISLANITGVRVRAGFWVNIIASTLKRDESQHPIAIVTAQKMGISQSVTTNLPDMILMPVTAVVSQVNNLFAPGGLQQPITAVSPADAPAPQAVPQTGSPPVPGQQAAGPAPVQNPAMPAIETAVQASPPSIDPSLQAPAAVAPQSSPAIVDSSTSNGNSTNTNLPPNGNAGEAVDRGIAPVTNTTGDTSRSLVPVEPIPPAPANNMDRAN